MFFASAVALAASQTAAKAPPEFWKTIGDVQSILNAVGSALGAVMIAWEGIKWMAAENPAEREDAKKGIIYVMIGLVLLKSSERIVRFLLVIP